MVAEEDNEDYSIPEAPLLSKNTGYSPYFPPTKHEDKPVIVVQENNSYPTNMNPYAPQPYPSEPYGYISEPSGKALASMIVAIFSVLLLPFPYIGFIPTIIAIILGHIALSNIKKKGQTGKGFALTGIIIGYAWFGIIFAIVGFAVFLMIAVYALGIPVI